MSRVHPKAWGRGQLASDVTTGSTTLMWMSRLDKMRWAAPFLPPWRFLSTIPPLMRPGLVTDNRILLLLDFSHKIDRYPGKILCTVLEKKLQKCSLSFGLKYPWVNRACVFFSFSQRRRIMTIPGSVVNIISTSTAVVFPYMLFKLKQIILKLHSAGLLEQKLQTSNGFLRFLLIGL